MVEARPNVLVILSDQLRRDALSIYGDRNIITPHIDRLAAGGVRFTAACSSYPICVPFRFTLMTGETAHSRFVPGIEWRMSPAERTLADEFNDTGYDTIYVGKWHLYGGHGLLPGHTCRKTNLTPVPRVHQGRWRKWLAFDVANNPFETHYFEDDDPTPKRLAGYQTDGLFDLAMDQLRGRAARGAESPFCCVLSVEPPHFPMEAPEQCLEEWLPRELHVPANFLVRPDDPPPGASLIGETERAETIDHNRRYYAMIRNLDDNVGRMMKFLKEMDLARNTIVVFVSDHGEMGGAHALAAAVKEHPYEESVGIPLIVRDPCGHARRGAALHAPVASEDLFPTLLGLAGLRPADRLPGEDLAPLIRGEADRLAREGVMLEFVCDFRNYMAYHGEYWRGFRTRRFKYTVRGDAAGSRPWQFFDLQNDPCELENLVDAPGWRGEVARHHRLLYERMTETSDHFVLSPAFGCPGLNLWSGK